MSVRESEVNRDIVREEEIGPVWGHRAVERVRRFREIELNRQCAQEGGLERQCMYPTREGGEGERGLGMECNDGCVREVHLLRE